MLYVLLDSCYHLPTKHYFTYHHLQIDLLQKRNKILEAQNIKLRLGRVSARSVVEEADDSSHTGLSTGATIDKLSSEKRRLDAPENNSPNVEKEEADTKESTTGQGKSMLAGNPVLEKWEADKKLQKKVETLQNKLKVGCLPIFCIKYQQGRLSPAKGIL